MNRRSKWISGLLAGGFLAMLATPLAAEEVRIGILAHRGGADCLKTWGPTAVILSGQIGKQVRIQPLAFDDVPVVLGTGGVDFYLVNPSLYVDLQHRFGGEAIASIINSVNGQPVEVFGGVLFTSAKSAIHTLSDIRGKRFMCVKKSSFGGYQMAQRLLQQNGINPEKDCTDFREAGTHDGVVEMVKAGRMDVGTVRTGTLESMAAAGRIRLEEFRILDPKDEGFPLVHSTRLYPEWPLARAAGTSKDLARRVAAVLISLPAGSMANQAAGIAGWATPYGYSEVETCLKETRSVSLAGK